MSWFVDFHALKNFDSIYPNFQITLVPVKIQDLIERNEVLETTIRVQLVKKRCNIVNNERNMFVLS